MAHRAGFVLELLPTDENFEADVLQRINREFVAL